MFFTGFSEQDGLKVPKHENFGFGFFWPLKSYRVTDLADKKKLFFKVLSSLKLRFLLILV